MPIILLLVLFAFSDADAQATCVQTCYVDVVNGTPTGDGTTPQTALQSIQSAITAIEAGGQVIIAPGVYDENLSIRKSLTLTGAGRDLTVIDAQGLANGVAIGGDAQIVTIKDLTVRNGNNDGISNNGSDLTLTRVRLTSNVDDGIQTTGALTLIDSLVDNNAYGVFVAGDMPATVTGSTITMNSVDGILANGALSITNSTISGNSSDAIQGSQSVNTTLTNTTIIGSLNLGIYDVLNSIIVGTCTTLNEVSDTFATSSACAGATIVPFAELGLGALQNNGGLTATHAISATSPAIDAVGGCTVETDQRGVARPQGDACDAGAYEWQPASIGVTVDALPDDTGTLFALSGVTGDVQLAHGETASATGLAPGTYTITPNLPDMWVIESAICDIDTFSFNGVTLSVTVTEGQSANCTVDVVYPFGNITVVKQAEPPAGWLDFGYTLTNGVNILETFTLNGGNDAPSDQTTFTDLPAGTYTITETTYPSNWILRDIICDTAQTITGDSVTVTLTPGADITCTFDNARRGQISITKFDDQDGDGIQDDTEPTLPGWRMRLFQQQPDETFEWIQQRLVVTGANGTTSYTSLMPGVYRVCEVPQVGWLNTNTDTFWQNGVVCQQITVDYAEVVPVAFGNTQVTSDTCHAARVIDFTQGTTLDGGTIEASRSDPTNALGAPQDNDTVNFVSLGFGGYIVLQLDGIVTDGEGVDLYIVETSFDTTLESVRVFAAELPSDWVQIGTLTEDGGVDFGGLIDQVGYILLIDSSDPTAFVSGVADGYDVDGIQCDPPPPATINVTKNILWNGMTPFAVAFDLCITGASYPTGNCQTVTADDQVVSWTVAPGDYVISEVNPGDDWLVDGSDVMVSAGSGETVAQTITNSYVIPEGTISVTKNIVWGDNIPFDAAFSLCITGPSYPNGDCQTVDGTTPVESWTVEVGDYLVTETDPGERWTVDGSDVTLTVTEDATTYHTITNTYVPPVPDGIIRVTKHIEWSGAAPVATEFTLCLSGVTQPDVPCYVVRNDGDMVFWEVPPGTYTITETDPGERWMVDGNAAQITVAPDETVDHTITNTYIPPPTGEIQVTKRINWNEATPFDTEFTICLTGETLPEPSCYVVRNDGDMLFWTVEPGDYLIVESYDDNWLVHGNEHRVTVNGGDVISHTITNNYVLPPPPPITPQPADPCEPGPMMSHLTGVLQVNGDASGVITNNSNHTCTYQVGLASYTMPSTDLYWQFLHAADVQTVTLAPGESVELRVGLPSCASQVDLFYGDVIGPQLGNDRYGTRLFAARWIDEGNWCEAPPGMNP